MLMSITLVSRPAGVPRPTTRGAGQRRGLTTAHATINPAQPDPDARAGPPTRRTALLSSLGATLGATLGLAILPTSVSAATAAKPPRLPVLDAKKLYGDKAGAARDAAVAALEAAIKPEAAGAVLRFAFHDAGTWDAVKGTGGANGSLRLELDRPENGGGLGYALAILSGAREAAHKAHPSLPQLTFADYAQLGGAVAVASTGGPRIEVPIGRPDAGRGDPAGQLPPLTLDAAGLRSLFGRNGYSDEAIVALSGAHTLGMVRANPPYKGNNLSPTPTKFDTSYFSALQKKKGVFPSDNALMTDPVFKGFVNTFARDRAAFFKAFTAAYIDMGLKGIAVPAAAV